MSTYKKQLYHLSTLMTMTHWLGLLGYPSLDQMLQISKTRPVQLYPFFKQTSMSVKFSPWQWLNNEHSKHFIRYVFLKRFPAIVSQTFLKAAIVIAGASIPLVCSSRGDDDCLLSQDISQLKEPRRISGKVQAEQFEEANGHQVQLLNRNHSFSCFWLVPFQDQDYCGLSVAITIGDKRRVIRSKACVVPSYWWM